MFIKLMWEGILLINRFIIFYLMRVVDNSFKLKLLISMILFY